VGNCADGTAFAAKSYCGEPKATRNAITANSCVSREKNTTECNTLAAVEVEL